jgi:hypothetical protein
MCDNCDMASDMWTGWINRVRELWNPNLHRHAGNARGIRRIDSLPKPPNVRSHSHSEDRSGECTHRDRGSLSLSLFFFFASHTF